MKIHPKLARRFAKNLDKEMNDRKISQRTLAEKCDMSQAYLSLILSGERENMTFEIVERVAGALKVDPARLLKE